MIMESTCWYDLQSIFCVIIFLKRQSQFLFLFINGDDSNSFTLDMMPLIIITYKWKEITRYDLHSIFCVIYSCITSALDERI